MTNLSAPAIPATAAPWGRALRRLRYRLGEVGVALVVPAALLLLWTISAALGWLPPQVLPSPADVGQGMLEMWRSGELVRHASISLLRVIYGFSAGAAAGLALGIAMGLSRRVEDYVKPLFTAFAQVPTLGWIPFLMLLVGIGEGLKILVIAKAAFVPMVLNTHAGIRSIPSGYFEIAAVFRFNRLQMLRHLVLPAAVPPIFTGVRYGLTHAWLALVAVELLASSEGLGYLLVWGRQMFWLDTVMIAMIAIGIVGFALDRATAGVERPLQRWRIADTDGRLAQP